MCDSHSDNSSLIFSLIFDVNATCAADLNEMFILVCQMLQTVSVTEVRMMCLFSLNGHLKFICISAS